MGGGAGDTDSFSFLVGFKQSFGCGVEKRKEKSGLVGCLGGERDDTVAVH